MIGGEATLAGSRPARLLTEQGHRYRDLNGNGWLDPYEDSRVPIEDRVGDLLARMTLEEKSGLLFHPGIPIGRRGGVVDGFHPMKIAPSTELVVQQNIRHFNIMMAPGPVAVARWHNRLQEIAEGTRLGIPITFSSDLRHAPGFNPACGVKQEGFSHWPAQLGLAAAGRRRPGGELRRCGPARVLGDRAARAAGPDGGPGHRTAVGKIRSHLRR